MCPNLAKLHYTATAVSKNLYVADFGPFLESESGDGPLACVTVHIALYREKRVPHTSRYLTPGFRYSIHIQVFAGIYGHESRMFIRGAFPYATSATHTIPTRNVSVNVVSRLSLNLSLTTVNHLSDHYNVSGSHRPGETVVLWKYGVWQIERQTSLGATGLELWMTLVCSTGSQTIDHQGTEKL